MKNRTKKIACLGISIVIAIFVRGQFFDYFHITGNDNILSTNFNILHMLASSIFAFIIGTCAYFALQWIIAKRNDKN